MRSRLNSELYLDLNRWLHMELNREKQAKSFQSLFQRLFVSSLGSLFESTLPQSYVSMRLAPGRQRLPGRQPVGRGVDVRIVASAQANTTYGMAAILSISPFPEREWPFSPTSADRRPSRRTEKLPATTRAAVRRVRGGTYSVSTILRVFPGPSPLVPGPSLTKYTPGASLRTSFAPGARSITLRPVAFIRLAA